MAHSNTPILSYDCPHCGVKNTAFKIINQSQNRLSYWQVYCECASCGSGCIAVLGGGCAPFEIDGNILLEPTSFWLHRFYPETEKLDYPDHIPDAILRNFIRGCKQLNPEDREGAAMSLGKSLDLAMKDLFPSKTGMLSQRIKSLAPGVDLPQSMIDWAGELNSLRNEGVHDSEEPDLADVTDLKNWLTLFFEYSYSLPKKLEELRARKSDR